MGAGASNGQNIVTKIRLGIDRLAITFSNKERVLCNILKKQEYYHASESERFIAHRFLHEDLVLHIYGILDTTKVTDCYRLVISKYSRKSLERSDNI